MRLELGTFPVTEIAFGAPTRYDAGRLTVDRDALLAAVREDPRIATAQLEIARPGESVRIWPVRDVIEPRIKVEGPGVCFPGNLRARHRHGGGGADASPGRHGGRGGVERQLARRGRGLRRDVSGHVRPVRRDVSLRRKPGCSTSYVEPDPTLGEEIKDYAVHEAALTVADQLGEAVRPRPGSDRGTR